MAGRYGLQVTAVEVQPELHRAAEELTQRCNLAISKWQFRMCAQTSWAQGCHWRYPTAHATRVLPATTTTYYTLFVLPCITFGYLFVYP